MFEQDISGSNFESQNITVSVRKRFGAMEEQNVAKVGNRSSPDSPHIVPADRGFSTPLEPGNWISVARARLSNSNLRFLAERSYIRRNGRIRSNGGIYSTSRRKKGMVGASRGGKWAGWGEARTKGRDHRHQLKARNYRD